MAYILEIIISFKQLIKFRQIYFFHNNNFFKKTVFDKNSLNKDLYKNLENEKTNIDYERVILKDLDRTFPKQSHFKTKYGTGQRSLYRVICSYSKYNKKIGICSRNGIYSCFIINLCG